MGTRVRANVVAVRAPVPWKWVTLFTVIKLAVTMAVADRYGWHRDELYYLASSRHLDFGYVDYPPVVPLLAAADQAIAHGSLVGLRLLPALSGTGIIVVTALIARELGANTRAQGWAAFAALLSPEFIGTNLMFQTVAFDELIWVLAIFVFARLLRDGTQWMWLVLGLVVGVGLETKFTIAALPVAMFVAVLISARRNVLATPWPWIGAAIALVLFLPNLAWQSMHDWISLQYTLTHRGHTDGPVAYWLQQLLLFSPLFLVPGIAGMVVLRRDPRFAPLVYTAILVELIFFAAGGKSYYPAPIYPAAYAAGAIWLDARLTTPARATAFVAAVVAFIAVTIPLLLPVLPAETMASTKIWQARKDYADMVGWPELVQETAQAYASLPADERSKAVIVAANYGEAGAIDYYGRDLGLPDAVSPHLTYYYWAPRRQDPATLVVVGFSLEAAQRFFGDCRQAGSVTNALGVRNEEYGGLILVCSHPRQPMWQIWPSLQTLS